MQKIHKMLEFLSKMLYTVRCWINSYTFVKEDFYGETHRHCFPRRTRTYHPRG